MSENVVATVTPDQVKATVEKFLSVAKFVAALTSTTTDDAVVAGLDTFLHQQYVLETLAWLISKVSKNEAVSPEEIKVRFAH